MFVSKGTLVSTKTPISLTNYSSSWFPSMPPMSSSGWPSAYAGIYRQQLWVYVVVNKLAKATARLPFPVYQRGEKGRVRVDDHPMATLLRNPNPDMTGYDLWLWTSSTRDTFGDTFWLKYRRPTPRADGNKFDLYPLHPAYMSWDEKSKRWNFDNGTLVLKDIKDTDVVPFKSFNPDSTTRGLSPLEPLRATLENEWSARSATSSFWTRGARPGMALRHPKQLSAVAQERLKAQMDAAAGGSSNTGSTVVLEEGMEITTLQLTAEEAQYIETRKLNREEVCAAYDIPPPVVHILDHATFSNITEQMRSMYRDTMGNILPGYESTIDLHIRQAEFAGEDIYAEFLMDEVLRGDFETRQDALAKASHMTIAEKRKIENLPFIDGTDRIFLNAAEQPLTAPQNDDAPAAPPFAQVGLPALVEADVISRDEARELLGIAGEAPEPEPIAEAVPLSVVRTVMGRLSWQKSANDVAPDDLVADLDPSHAAVVLAELEKSAGESVAELRARIRLIQTLSEEDV